MDKPGSVHTAITFTHRPSNLTARGEPAAESGGARVMVTPAGLTAIRSPVVDDDGQLPMTARSALARIDDHGGHASEPSVPVWALARQHEFVRIEGGLA